MKTIYLLSFLFISFASFGQWAQLPMSGAAPFECIQFVDSDLGFVGGLPLEHFITKTTDGGNTWTTVNSSAAADQLQTVYFPSPQVGYSRGLAGSQIKTTDGGAAWTALPFQINNSYQDLYFEDGNII